jgi:hypothetical protein
MMETEKILVRLLAKLEDKMDANQNKAKAAGKNERR